MWLVVNFLVLHDGKNIIGAEKKEVENVTGIVMVIFTVKIQNNLKKKNSSLIKLEFFYYKPSTSFIVYSPAFFPARNSTALTAPSENIFLDNASCFISIISSFFA